MTSWLDRPIVPFSGRIKRSRPKPLDDFIWKEDDAEASLREIKARLLLAKFEAEEARIGGPTWVYCLWWPPKKRPFYIGISVDPWMRFKQHQTDWGCNTKPYVRNLLEAGYQRDQILKLYKQCESRSEAMAVEWRLIETTPHVINRTKGKIFQEPKWWG